MEKPGSTVPVGDMPKSFNDQISEDVNANAAGLEKLLDLVNSLSEQVKACSSAHSAQGQDKAEGAPASVSSQESTAMKAMRRIDAIRSTPGFSEIPALVAELESLEDVVLSSLRGNSKTSSSNKKKHKKKKKDKKASVAGGAAAASVATSAVESKQPASAYSVVVCFAMKAPVRGLNCGY